MQNYEMLELTGTVGTIIYRNKDNGYTVIELDDEDATIEHRNDGSPDVIVYTTEVCEIKRGHDDADFEFTVRCRAIDKQVLSAELSWKTDADGSAGERHVALYRALARRSDLFVQYGK